MKSEWNEASLRARCPICAGIDWCTRSTDGLVVCCRRVSDGGEQRLDKRHEAFFLHRLGDQAAYTQTRVQVPLTTEPAGPDLLNRMNRDLLAQLELSDAHRQALEARGIPGTVIKRLGLKTLPPERKKRLALGSALYRAHGANCTGLPGWCLRDGRPFITGWPGLLIPVADVSGRVVAIKTRADNPTDPSQRYRWLSSASEGGAHARSVAFYHLPGPKLKRGARLQEARITEGELKAVIIAEATGMLTVSSPGVSNFAQTFPILRLVAPRRVHLCFDQDWRTKPRVASALLQAYTALAAEGFEPIIETWPSQFKGADDYLTSGEAA